MGEKSKIQWTDATWNPWHGCKKVSPGCKFCYMYRDKERYGDDDPSIVRKSKTKFFEPLKWKDPKLIFTCSWSDFFIEEADEWRSDAWNVIRQTPQHTYQILTKRPERIHESLPAWFDAIAYNVLIGVSIEDQSNVNRLEYLVDLPCRTFVSFEPLLGKISWTEFMSILDWCIIGGESGNDQGKYRYRRCDLSWITHLISEFKYRETPVFVKQLGTHLAKELRLKDRFGGDITEWPRHLQHRESFL